MAYPAAWITARSLSWRFVPRFKPTRAGFRWRSGIPREEAVGSKRRNTLRGLIDFFLYSGNIKKRYRLQ